MKALTIYVLRPDELGDCTNGGISSRYKRLLLVCPDGNTDVDPEDPPENLVKMVSRTILGTDVFHIEPFKEPQHIGWMAGGNFAYSCDARFNDMINFYGAVSIHDRQETSQLNDRLSI